MLRISSAVPAGQVFVGDGVSMQVQLRLADAVTAVAGRSVALHGGGGPGFAAGVCRGALCGDDGCRRKRASVTVTASAAGPVSVSAVEAGGASNTVSFSFTAVDKPDSLQPVSAPSGNVFVGAEAPTAFAVRVLDGKGVGAAGRSVVFSVTGGQARLEACGQAVCSVVTDASGLASTGVTPLGGRGLSGLRAAEAGNVLTGAFTAVARPDTMAIVGTPGASVRVGETVGRAVSACR